MLFDLNSETRFGILSSFATVWCFKLATERLTKTYLAEDAIKKHTEFPNLFIGKNRRTIQRMGGRVISLLTVSDTLFAVRLTFLLLECQMPVYHHAKSQFTISLAVSFSSLRW